MFLAVVLLLVLMNPAFAQPVYKCTVDGKAAYGDQPCTAGPTVELDVPAAPADPHGAHELQRQKAMLASLQKQRYAREARAARARARGARAAAAQQRRCARMGLKQRWMDEDINKAMSEQRESARAKAHRHRQSMAIECPG